MVKVIWDILILLSSNHKRGNKAFYFLPTGVAGRKHYLTWRSVTVWLCKYNKELPVILVTLKFWKSLYPEVDHSSNNMYNKQFVVTEISHMGSLYFWVNLSFLTWSLRYLNACRCTFIYAQWQRYEYKHDTHISVFLKRLPACVTLATSRDDTLSRWRMWLYILCFYSLVYWVSYIIMYVYVCMM